MPHIKGDFWVECMKVKYLNELKKNPDTNICLADVRFHNEVDTIHKLGGIVVKIDRPGFGNNDCHESERNIDLIKNYDHKIVNDGTLEDLYKKVDDFVKELNV